jgi:hypothetical protein
MVPLTTTRGLAIFSLNFISPNREYIIDDFPAPISPMIATIYPFLIVKLVSINVKGVSPFASDSLESLSQ